jgi:hypothetical protein
VARNPQLGLVAFWSHESRPDLGPWITGELLFLNQPLTKIQGVLGLRPYLALGFTMVYPIQNFIPPPGRKLPLTLCRRLGGMAQIENLPLRWQHGFEQFIKYRGKWPVYIDDNDIPIQTM